MAQVYMVLCPNCRSIQKAGTICPICKCPIPLKEESDGKAVLLFKVQNAYRQRASEIRSLKWNYESFVPFLQKNSWKRTPRLKFKKLVSLKGLRRCWTRKK